MYSSSLSLSCQFVPFASSLSSSLSCRPGFNYVFFWHRHGAPLATAFSTTSVLVVRCGAIHFSSSCSCMCRVNLDYIVRQVCE